MKDLFAHFLIPPKLGTLYEDIQANRSFIFGTPAASLPSPGLPQPLPWRAWLSAGHSMKGLVHMAPFHHLNPTYESSLGTRLSGKQC